MSAVTAYAAGDDDRARQRLHDTADTDYSLALEIAERVGGRLLPYAGRASWTGYFIFAPVDLTLARIAESQHRSADAADHLDVALAVSERLEAPIFIGRTLTRMAQMATAHPELAPRWPWLAERLAASAAAADENDWSALQREIAEAGG